MFLANSWRGLCNCSGGNLNKFCGSVSGTDFVFFISPPPLYSGDRCNFKAGQGSCWYGRMVLLFKMKVEADNELVECSCAMIEVFFDYRPARPRAQDWVQL